MKLLPRGKKVRPVTDEPDREHHKQLTSSHQQMSNRAADLLTDADGRLFPIPERDIWSAHCLSNMNSTTS